MIMELAVCPWIFSLLLFLLNDVSEGYNQTLCDKAYLCDTDEPRGTTSSYNMDKRCLQARKYEECMSTHAPFCPDSLREKLRRKVRCKRYTSYRDSTKCSNVFAGCITPNFKALRERPGAEEEICRLAPRVIQCMEDALMNFCREKGKDETEIMSQVLADMKNHINCNFNKSSRPLWRHHILLPMYLLILLFM